MNETLFKNYIHQLKAPKTDKYERAKIIYAYINEKGITQREFARRFGMHHNTIQDWLLPLRLPEHQYKNLVENHSITDIYRVLRSTKEIDIDKSSGFEKELLFILNKISKLKHNAEFSLQAKETLNDIKKQLNYLEFRMEKKI